jgi:phosphoribosylamine-glycine ligase
MNFDLVALFQTVIKNQLHTFKFLWKKGTAINIVLASNGYPKNYKIGYQINIQHQPLVFFANTIIKENKLLTNGGRVLSVVAVGKSVKDAYVKVYKEIKNINFKRMYFRKDIGLN